MMKTAKLLTYVLLISLLLALAGIAGLGLAQGPQPPEGEVGMEGEVGAEAVVDNTIPIQGRLTDSSGNPLDGSYTLRMRLYDVFTGGTLLCEDEDTVTVDNGLFTAYMDYCTASDIDGRPLYLGVQVGSDPEMTPRKRIYPVPYAFSLRPGAVISNTETSGHALEVWGAGGGGANGTTLWLRNTSTGGGIALWAIAQGTDATLISSADGTGPIFKGFGGDGGEHEFIIHNNGSVWTEGDVSQSGTADGLVKAAVVGECSATASTVYRSFNNVTGGSVAITNGAAAGQCIVDFGFAISGRYWIATGAGSQPRHATCALYPEPSTTRLDCYVWDAAGTGVNGSIIVTLY